MNGVPLKVSGDLSAIKELQNLGADTLKRCYQCATCSTVCPLSTDEIPFPRKQMILAQWGLKDRLLSDPALWLCHQCGDCSKYCPRDAKPGDVLGALRIAAIKEAVPFRFLHTFYNNIWGIPILAAIALFFILLMSVITFQGIPNFFDAESFPYGGPTYHILFLHLPARVLMIDLIFIPLAIFVCIMLAIGINKLWNSFVETCKIPQAYRYSMWYILAIYLIPAIKEILAHSRFTKCDANHWRARPHKILFISFIILALTTALVFFLGDVLGFETPFNPFLHPVKWLGNLGAILLLWSIIKIMTGRSQAEMEKSVKTSYPDSFLIWLIFFIGLTGVSIEVIRLIPGLRNIVSIVYITHLVCVFILFLGAAYSKFAHLAFRTTAVVFDIYYRDVMNQLKAIEEKNSGVKEVSEENEVKEEAPEEETASQSA